MPIDPPNRCASPSNQIVSEHPVAMESESRPTSSSAIKRNFSGASEGTPAKQLNQVSLAPMMRASNNRPAPVSDAVASCAVASAQFVDSPEVRRQCRDAILESIDVRFINDRMVPDVNGNCLEIAGTFGCSAFKRHISEIQFDQLNEFRMELNEFFKCVVYANNLRSHFAGSLDLSSGPGEREEIVDAMSIRSVRGTRASREPDIRELLRVVATVNQPTPRSYRPSEFSEEVRHFIILKIINAVGSRPGADSNAFAQTLRAEHPQVMNTPSRLEIPAARLESLEALRTRYLALADRVGGACWMNDEWQSLDGRSIDALATHMKKFPIPPVAKSVAVSLWIQRQARSAVLNSIDARCVNSRGLPDVDGKYLEISSVFSCNTLRHGEFTAELQQLNKNRLAINALFLRLMQKVRRGYRSGFSGTMVVPPREKLFGKLLDVTSLTLLGDTPKEHEEVISTLLREANAAPDPEPQDDTSSKILDEVRQLITRKIIHAVGSRSDARSKAFANALGDLYAGGANTVSWYVEPRVSNRQSLDALRAEYLNHVDSHQLANPHVPEFGLPDYRLLDWQSYVS